MKRSGLAVANFAEVEKTFFTPLRGCRRASAIAVEQRFVRCCVERFNAPFLQVNFRDRPRESLSSGRKLSNTLGVRTRRVSLRYSGSNGEFLGPGTKQCLTLRKTLNP